METEWILCITSIFSTLISFISLLWSIVNTRKIKEIEKRIKNIGGSAVANTGNGTVNIIGPTTGGNANLHLK